MTDTIKTPALSLCALWHYPQTPKRLATDARLRFAVVSDTGVVWEVYASQIGATRARNKHRRNYMRATNHYARFAEVVPLPAGWLRGAVVAACKAQPQDGTVGADLARAALEAVGS